ncbi:dTDP-4-dehydrorhamnose reductase [Desulfofarcimen acetoxidans DSM 771]|uniref:dTDP-4-dehydrorhamnose reductase n=1 Tax=Desulfofarcimen acetoxidans (strain ATCC 49208 / DSM 771 / KCTC 5769 / VKM B-1644 / 5575) TaxID=485916 RepID=C8VYS6_DESAS|nr:dTDP-4-dehydrorhamnose reductase [Desulfofarcimen acetoxidans DSM 771]
MNVTKTNFKGLFVIETNVHGDNRGWFTETYTKSKFAAQGIDTDFVQDNQSYSAQKGTLRGIHFQTNPMAQTKMIRCTRGAIIDTVVDLRKGSDTYKQWYSIELSAENKKQMYIPKGFGHAFLTITEDVEVQYKVDEYYSKECDRSIKFNDPEIGIDWGIENPVLSQKDLNAPLLKDSDADFSIKVLVTGVEGQLGYDVVKRLNLLGIENIGVDRTDFDITDKEQTEAYIFDCKPDVVIHCAAYTAVDKAEEEQGLCYAINVDGTRYISEACKKIDAKMLYISTDYVFDGEGTEAQKEDKPTAPANYYGYSKEQGELLVKELLEKYFIIRTSWVYGKNGNNFVKTMLKLGQTKDEISVVNDQVGVPTYTPDLAVSICDMLQTTKYGTYHVVNEGYCSWYEFVVEIFKQAGINIKVNSIPTSEYPTRAKRPLNSRLSKEKLDKNGFNRLPEWKDALKRYLDEL